MFFVVLFSINMCKPDLNRTFVGAVSFVLLFIVQMPKNQFGCKKNSVFISALKIQTTPKTNLKMFHYGI